MTEEVKSVVEEEKRWLHHAQHEPKIFEAAEIAGKLAEGWVKWPWEIKKKVGKKESVSHETEPKGLANVKPEEDKEQA